MNYPKLPSVLDEKALIKGLEEVFFKRFLKDR